MIESPRFRKCFSSRSIKKWRGLHRLGLFEAKRREATPRRASTAFLGTKTRLLSYSWVSRLLSLLRVLLASPQFFLSHNILGLQAQITKTQDLAESQIGRRLRVAHPGEAALTGIYTEGELIRKSLHPRRVGGRAVRHWRELALICIDKLPQKIIITTEHQVAAAGAKRHGIIWTRQL